MQTNTLYKYKTGPASYDTNKDVQLKGGMFNLAKPKTDVVRYSKRPPSSSGSDRRRGKKV